MEGLTIFGLEPSIFLIKAAVFIGAMFLTWFVQHYVCKLLHRLLNTFDNLPSASILVTFVRVAIWAIGILSVLRPVFGIEPTVAVAALGVTSVALSLGLKDTISNLFGGLALMIGKVLRPGDFVSIAGTTGSVKDVMLRHTVIETRLHEHIVIPNSVLNTTTINRLPDEFESRVTFDFTIDPGYPVEQAIEDLLATVRRAVGGDLKPEFEPYVLLDGISPYGTTGRLIFFVREGLSIDRMRDVAVRAVANKAYFSENAAACARGIPLAE